MALLEDLHKAHERAREGREKVHEKVSVAARDAQDKVTVAARDAQDLARDLQERALEVARQRADEAREQARRAAATMPPGLLVRLIVSVLGIPFIITAVFVEGPPKLAALPFTVLTAAAALVGGYEFFTALRRSPSRFRPTEGLAYIAIVLLQFAAWKASRDELNSFLPALLAILVILTLMHQVQRREGEPIVNTAVTFFGVVYVGWLFSYLIWLRSLPGSIVVPLPFFGYSFPSASWGAWILLYVFAVTWSTDSGAYFAGMRWGKTPLAPRLSPKKTREGAVGGVIAALCMSILWGTWIGLPWYHCLILGPALGALGQVGDLCESALKRDLGIKDFGALLPGHGGILDRFDSLLFTAPIAYYYLVIVIPRLAELLPK